MALPGSIEFANYLEALEATCSYNVDYDVFNIRRVSLWRNRPIEWNLLMAAVQFWYPEDHVFRFGLDEVCPTYEEFSAMMGINPSVAAALPEFSRSPRDLLAGLLRISPSAARSLVVGGMISLPAVLQSVHLREVGDAGHSGAVVLGLVSKLLLVTGELLVDPQLAAITSWMSYRRNPAAVILAETLNGLDAWREGRSDFLRGIPVMLFMWLSERLRLVALPEYPLSAVPNFFSRHFFIFGQDVAGWENWFVENGARNLTGQCLGGGSCSLFWS